MQSPIPTAWNENSDASERKEIAYLEIMRSQFQNNPSNNVWDYFIQNMPIQATQKVWKQFFAQLKRMEDQELDRRNQLILDIQSRWVPVKSRYPCPIKNCDKSFTKKADAKIHCKSKHHDRPEQWELYFAKVIHDKTKATFPCPFVDCEMGFSKKDDLIRHINCKKHRIG